MTSGTMMQFFHWYYPADGTLWDHAKDKAKELAGWGITALWLPPATKGKDGAKSSGYDAYDLYDLGEFHQKGSLRTKYGTKDGYTAALHALQENGITVYADVVLNHKAGADEKEKVSAIRVNPDNRNELIEPVEIEAYTKFTFPGRKGKYLAGRGKERVNSRGRGVRWCYPMARRRRRRWKWERFMRARALSICWA